MSLNRIECHRRRVVTEQRGDPVMLYTASTPTMKSGNGILVVFLKQAGLKNYMRKSECQSNRGFNSPGPPSRQPTPCSRGFSGRPSMFPSACQQEREARRVVSNTASNWL